MRCLAVTRVKRNFVNHTIRCQHPEGHDGGHEAKDGARTTIWYGEVAPLPTNMRYRFGLDPHWMMKGSGGRDGGDSGVW